MKPLVLYIGKTEFLIEQGETITIGRDLSCDIKLSDKHISKRHATIEYYAKNQVYLTDHNSTNGTYYNKVPIINKMQVNKEVAGRE